MTLVELLLLLIIGGLCGGIAQSLVGYSRGGCLTSIAVGFIGSLLGAFISREVGLPAIFTLQIGGVPFPIIWSILGGTIFVGLLSLLSRSRR